MCRSFAILLTIYAACQLQGPNVCGGYIHPLTGKTVTREEHEKMVAESTKRWEAEHASKGHGHHH